MKATLLIKNIEKIYTCDSNFTIIEHGYIALHHDKIIDISSGSYKHWLDDATRVIDARGEIVVPAFIDCDFQGFEHVSMGDQLREDHAALYAMQKNGILTLLTRRSRLQRMELTQDVFVRKTKSNVPIVSAIDRVDETKLDRFMLSCGFGTPNAYVYSLQPLAYILFSMYHVKARSLLEAMTSLPAKEFDLKDRGSIKTGKIGDLLILQVPSIEHYYQTVGTPLIHRMIKNGIPFFPHWMVC